MALVRFEALSGENNAYAVDLTDSLPTGVTLSASAGVATVYDIFETDVTLSILASAAVTQSASLNTATFTLKTGAKPFGVYRVHLACPQSNSKTLEEDALLVIREFAV